MSERLGPEGAESIVDDESPVRSLLALRPFRRFLVASTLTSIVNGTTRFTFVWAMGDLTNWESAIGLLGIMLGLPALIFSPLSGSLADRFDRRYVAGFASALLAVACGIVAWLLSADSLGPLGLGIAAFIVSVPLATIGPAVQAMVPSLAPRERIMNAVALQNLSMMGSLIAGAFLGGAVITVFGTGAAFGVMAATSAIAAMQLFTLADPPTAATDGPVGRSGGIRDGLRHVRANPMIGVLIAMAAFIGIGSATAQLFLPELARDELDVGAFGAGVLSASMSVGLIITAGYLATRLSINRPGRTLAIVFGAIAGPGMVAFGLSPVFAVAVLVGLIWGLGGGVVLTLQRSMIQQRTDDEVMGRVMGLYAMAQFGTFPFTAFALFLLVDPLGVRGTFVVLGLVLTAGAVSLGFILQRLENREQGG